MSPIEAYQSVSKNDLGKEGNAYSEKEKVVEGSWEVVSYLILVKGT